MTAADTLSPEVFSFPGRCSPSKCQKAIVGNIIASGEKRSVAQRDGMVAVHGLQPFVWHTGQGTDIDTLLEQCPFQNITVLH